MNKIIPCLIALFSCITLFAQTTSTKAPGHFVLKGQAKNQTQPFLEFGVSGFFNPEMTSAQFNKDGTFSKTISITHPQDLFLILGDKDAIMLFAEPGDTIEVNWDYNDIYNSFHVICSKPWRQPELDLMLQWSKKFIPNMEQFFTKLNAKDLSDSAIVELIKKNMAEEMAMATSVPGIINKTKIFGDIYYRHVKMLYSKRLLPKYKLSLYEALPKKLADSLHSYFFNINSDILYEDLFYVSKEYRDFIFDQVRFYKPFQAWSQSNGSKQPIPNYPLNDCYAGAATLNYIPSILDWYLAQAIMFGFGHYPFKDSEEAYEKFAAQIKTPMFREPLEQYYASVQRLKPGAPAPAFTLKNSIGKNVSLSDLKGKVVYIDFWGVGCGPCIYDIKNYSQKIHERYKDKEVVFVSICVDVKEKEWKENITKLKLEGINLIAEGWTTHPVCKDYDVTSIPHYILIDQKGNIVNNNAGRMGEILGEHENQIDKLLK